MHGHSCICLHTHSVVAYIHLQGNHCLSCWRVLDFPLVVSFSVSGTFLATVSMLHPQPLHPLGDHTPFPTQVLYPPILRQLFVPSFLLCWPAGYVLRGAIVQLAQRTTIRQSNSVFRVKAVNLAITCINFLFTW